MDRLRQLTQLDQRQKKLLIIWIDVKVVSNEACDYISSKIRVEGGEGV